MIDIDPGDESREIYFAQIIPEPISYILMFIGGGAMFLGKRFRSLDGNITSS